MSKIDEFETRSIHSGQEPDPTTGAVVPPLYQVSTFKQDSVQTTRAGYEYSRTANPTRSSLEESVTALENGAAGYAYGSGLAAADALLRTVCAPGDHIVLPQDPYGGMFRLVDQVLRRWGITYTTAPMSDVDAVREALRPETKVVWVETPTNPYLGLADLAALAELTRGTDVLLTADNTLATPYLQQPLDFGADVVVHSTSKYLGGHSDVVGGVVVVQDEELGAGLKANQVATGPGASPFESWLTLRGIKTLAPRMRSHCDNAEHVANALVDHPAVSDVFYPGFTDHPDHEVAARQMRRFGGMVSFRVRGGRAAAERVCAATRLFSLGVSLGGVESLLAHPASMTHASMAGTELEVPGDLIRLSVGIESATDLVADLQQALS